MAKISIEVRSGTARFAVAVQAHTIQQTLSFVQAGYPGTVARVTFPTDREGSCVEDRAA